MTPLEARIKARIVAQGPMSVAEYMATCLLDPAYGYYTTREPFGRNGDFITAPEISQMFGELLATWLHAAWTASGRSPNAVLAEIGPGRGTLMKDVLRTLRQIDSGWAPKLSAFLIEASPKLRAVQAETLGAVADVQWCDGLDALPSGPLFLLGNEIFDALPIRQYVKVNGMWRERLIGLGEDDALGFVAGPGAPDPALLPAGADDAAENSVVELSPAREGLMEQIAARITGSGGAALFIDYGHLEPGFGDTFQAVGNHRYVSVFDCPGEADLTSHVDFASLAAVAQHHGLAAWSATQGDFLLSLGLLERAGLLGAKADEATRARLQGEVERLAAPEAMGTLFKVLAVAQPGISPPGLRRFGTLAED